MGSKSSEEEYNLNLPGLLGCNTQKIVLVKIDLEKGNGLLPQAFSRTLKKANAKGKKEQSIGVAKIEAQDQIGPEERAFLAVQASSLAIFLKRPLF